MPDKLCGRYIAYIRPKSRTERPRKTKIGTEIAHVTRDSDTTFKVKRSKVNLHGRDILWRRPAQLVQRTVIEYDVFAWSVVSETRSLDRGLRTAAVVYSSLYTSLSLLSVSRVLNLSLTSCARGDTIYLRPLQVDHIFVFIRIYSCGSVPACWQFRTSATSWPLTFWPWKWCPSHVWRGLPLCRFYIFLGLSILGLCPMYATDRRRQTSDKSIINSLDVPDYCLVRVQRCIPRTAVSKATTHWRPVVYMMLRCTKRFGLGWIR